VLALYQSKLKYFFYSFFIVWGIQWTLNNFTDDYITCLNIVFPPHTINSKFWYSFYYRLLNSLWFRHRLVWNNMFLEIRSVFRWLHQQVALKYCIFGRGIDKTFLHLITEMLCLYHATFIIDHKCYSLLTILKEIILQNLMTNIG